MKAKLKVLLLCGIVVVCTVLSTLFIAKGLHSETTKPIPQDIISTKHSMETINKLSESNDIQAALPVAVESKKPEIESTANPTKRLIGEIEELDFLLDDLTVEVNNELFLLDNLSDADLQEYHRLYNLIKTTNNADDIGIFVDFVDAIVQRYWQSQSPKLAHQVALKTLQQVEKSQLLALGSKDVELQKIRLLVWLFRIERAWGGKLHIPAFQEDLAKACYTHLEQLTPDSELGEYVKQIVLYESQQPLLASLSNVKPLAIVINSPPQGGNVRDKITVARLKTKAFLEWGKISSHGQDFFDLGRLYQYAIDYIEAIPSDVTDAMNNCDRQYFYEITNQAVYKLAELRSKAAIASFDFDRALKLREPVELYRRAEAE